MSHRITDRTSSSEPISETLAAYTDARVGEFGLISAERVRELDALASHIRATLDDGKPARLVFVCTHNSRRSHLAMIWAGVASARYGVGPVEVFSAGTEATAFNPRAVAAIERAGIEVERMSEEDNPVYRVAFAGGREPLECFSKTLDHPSLPVETFAAVMVCGEADASCPTVPGCQFRAAIRYVDPKASDGTPDETATYDERCAQIAREMLYVFSRVG